MEKAKIEYVKKGIKKRILMCFSALSFILPILFTSKAFAKEETTGDSKFKLDGIEVKENYLGTVSDVKVVFTYALEALDENAPMPEGSENNIKIITITANTTEYANESFGSINYEKTGEWHYKISQVETNNKNCQKDETEYYLTVYVTRDGEVTSTLSDKNNTIKYASAEFNNALIYQIPAREDPPVKKRIEGSGYDTASEFIFEMKGTTGTEPLPESSRYSDKTARLVLKGGESGEFGYIEYDTPGVYVYEVYEVNNNIPGFTYDKTVYILRMTVYDDGESLKVKREYERNNERDLAIAVFTNKYNETKKNDESKVNDDSKVKDTSKKDDIVSRLKEVTGLPEGSITNIGIIFAVIIIVVIVLSVILVKRKKRHSNG